MIPKIIHYCWFGNNPLPEPVKKCVQSWEKQCPDYEIIQWTEENFDITIHPYIREAYESKKWAFASDLARLLIVYEYGGIYLDTDVELIRPLDDVLNNTFFFGIEKNKNTITGEDSIHVATGLGFGAEKNNNVLKSLINEYDNCNFVLGEGKFDKTPCPVRNTYALEKYGYNGKDELYVFEGGTIYPSEFFCPIEYSTKKMTITPNTISIHHYDSSWKTKNDKRIETVKNRIKKTIYVISNCKWKK